MSQLIKAKLSIILSQKEPYKRKMIEKDSDINAQDEL